jgi:phage-related protein
MSAEAVMPNWTVEGYLDARGRNLIQEYTVGLPPRDQARITRAIDLLADYGPLLRMPHARHLQGKVWELRIDGRPNSFRVL